MPSVKYALPEFLAGRCAPEAYHRWLSRKAIAHVKRDRKRGHEKVTREVYMIAIHKAVIASRGLDDYTGQKLAWESISKYDNMKSKDGSGQYKKSLWDLPSLDHCGDDITANAFRICAWRTNDCKNDLNYDQLIDFCRMILAHHEAKSGK